MLPPLLESNAAEAARAVARAGVGPLTLDIEGEKLTFDVENEGLTVRRDGVEALLVSLNRPTFSDLIQGTVTTFGLLMSGRAEIVKGTPDSFMEWEPALRCLLDGREAYESGSISFEDRHGAPLDLHRSFSLDDDPEDLGQFLGQAGFLHVEGVFSEAEMAAVSAELDQAVAAAERNDGASWWARTDAGEWYPSRILGFNQKSLTLRQLLHSDRFGSIGRLTNDKFVQRNVDAGDSAEGLLKKVGVVEGISDVSWHKDCSLGDHSRLCCGLTVGICVTDATHANGELGVVPGSHRANISPIGIEGLDLSRVPLPTRTGDITVHCSCTLHMSRPPVSAERRVVYTGFELALRPGDHRVEIDPAEARRERAALNDRVPSSQLMTETTRVASFEL
jgi:hypothetical protein